jgi:hypothetical protein
MINKKAFALAGAVIGLGGVFYLLDRAKGRFRDQVINDSIAAKETDIDFEFDLNELGELPPVLIEAQRLDRRRVLGSRNPVAPLNGRRNPNNNKSGYFNRGAR